MLQTGALGRTGARGTRQSLNSTFIPIRYPILLRRDCVPTTRTLSLGVLLTVRWAGCLAIGEPLSTPLVRVTWQAAWRWSLLSRCQAPIGLPLTSLGIPLAPIAFPWASVGIPPAPTWIPLSPIGIPHPAWYGRLCQANCQAILSSDVSSDLSSVSLMFYNENACVKRFVKRIS